MERKPGTALNEDQDWGAFFEPPPEAASQKTGLSAPIPRPLWGLRDFRFYPLRGIRRRHYRGEKKDPAEAGSCG
jgi:hypothetical protein